MKRRKRARKINELLRGRRGISVIEQVFLVGIVSVCVAASGKLIVQNSMLKGDQCMQTIPIGTRCQRGPLPGGAGNDNYRKVNKKVPDGKEPFPGGGLVPK